MATFIQNKKTGKFAGSIGVGKNVTPTVAAHKVVSGLAPQDVNPEQVEGLYLEYKRTKETQENVNDKLRLLGNRFLKEPYKSRWSEDNPTLGYCYIVSEAFYHYGGLENPVPYVMSFPDGGTHWWLRDGDKIVDFTGNQFPEKVDYSKGVRCPFFKGGVTTPNGGHISKRGQHIAELLGLSPVST